MECRYFPGADGQPHQKLAFGDPITSKQVAQNHFTNDGNGNLQIDTTNLGGLLPADFEYSFDAPMGHDIPGVMALSGSMPSPAYPLSLLPNNLDDSGFALYIESESSPQRRRGSSEGNESGMPARSRRKAQNRAAQRAFRERKERHVRDLEAKLNLMTTTTSSLQSDNDRLRLLLEQALSDNESLRVTSTTSSRAQAPSGSEQERERTPFPASGSSQSPLSDGGRALHTASLTDSLLSPEPSTSKPSRSSRLLSPNAAWDLLQLHLVYASGALNKGDISERLRELARHNSTGPALDEDDVRRIIDEVARSSVDNVV